MAVNTTYAAIEQAGNGITVAFGFAFKILAKTDLVVRKKLSDGTYTVPLTLDVDYTVVFDSAAETGTVTYTAAPVTGGASNIQRVSDKTQGTIYPREGPFPAKTNETVVDKLTLLVQELIERVATRAPLYPAVPPAPAQLIIKPATDRRAMIYATNGDGTFNIVPSANDPDVMVIAAGASATAAAASQAAASASAAAALASQTAAAASQVAAAASAVAAAASASAMAGTSGLFSARPAGGAVRLYYYATDHDQEYEWSPAAAKWYVKG